MLTVFFPDVGTNESVESAQAVVANGHEAANSDDQDGQEDIEQGGESMQTILLDSRRVGGGANLLNSHFLSECQPAT
jgi:hypothetical protein